MKNILKESYDAYKEKNDWVVVDYDTYVDRTHIIAQIDESYPYEHELYEKHEGPTDEDAKGLDQEEWDEMLKSFLDNYPMILINKR